MFAFNITEGISLRVSVLHHNNFIASSEAVSSAYFHMYLIWFQLSQELKLHQATAKPLSAGSVLQNQTCKNTLSF